MGSTFPQAVWRARRCLSSTASSRHRCVAQEACASSRSCSAATISSSVRPRLFPHRRLLTPASVRSIRALCWRPARRSCEVRRMGSSMASDELLEPGLLEHGLLEHGLPEHALRVARTYSAAADHYALGSLSFWNRFGAGTVSRLPLQPGQSVLDLCCGAGASAIPAARAVGPGGHVLGIDLAEPLLEQASAKAAAERLPNIEFRRGNAISTGLPAASFDAVVCVSAAFWP